MHINDLFLTNLLRSERWHNGGIYQWSALEWAGAMCGEAGEAANDAKKLRRLELEIPSINTNDVKPYHYTDIDAAKYAVAKEVADTLLYGLLLMARVGITDPEQVIRDVFNKKSLEYGFPERL